MYFLFVEHLVNLQRKNEIIKNFPKIIFNGWNCDFISTYVKDCKFQAERY